MKATVKSHFLNVQIVYDAIINASKLQSANASSISQKKRRVRIRLIKTVSDVFQATAVEILLTVNAFTTMYLELIFQLLLP